MKKYLFSIICLLCFSVFGYSQTCDLSSSLTVSPQPTNGTYAPGTPVTFCFTVSNWDEVNANWLHGVTPTFGPGWNTSTITTVPPPSVGGGGTWSWYPGGETSSNTGNTYGAGFYFESDEGSPNGVVDNDPGNNFGDYGSGPWTFCMTVTTSSTCVPGQNDLSVSIQTTGDGDSGSWGSSGTCTVDVPVSAPSATLICPTCTSSITFTPVSCHGGSDGTATVTSTLGVAPITYLWSNGQTTTTITGLTAGQYYVSVTDNTNCVSGDTVIVTEPPLLTSSTTQVNVSCNGFSDGSATVTGAGGTPPYTYLWSNGGTSANVTNLAAGTYTAIVTDFNSCISTSVVVITQPAPVIPTYTTTPLDGCNPLVVTYTSTTPGATCVWTINGIATTNCTVTEAFSTPGSYPAILTVTDIATGCIETSPVITANSLASPICTITATPDSGCAPLTVNFTSTGVPAGGTCLWDFGNGTTSTSCNPQVTFTNYLASPFTINYTYTITGGCTNTATQRIYVFSQPVAIFNATPQPTTIDHPQINFNNSSTGVINNWNWTFGVPGGYSSDQSPTYTYTDTGTYHVQLIVSNVHNCIDTTSETVIIDPILTCYIPNAFTPNGNGNDDVFMIRGTTIIPDNFMMSIFDRWGEEVFHTGDISVGWNGQKFNTGNPVEIGVYVYKIHLKDWKGLEHDYVGHVTVLR